MRTMHVQVTLDVLVKADEDANMNDIHSRIAKLLRTHNVNWNGQKFQVDDCNIVDSKVTDSR